ncbi:TIGR02594 family protein [Shimia sp. R9_3]|uniref:NlpC/P60 family protein n=1 Tax=Shimia sp. R9_3 TaxID=2821113 RepID=UPI001AD99F2A|nr:TIGR02594 family protein [Shimia sp. R9_3]MBO9401611.1 TIGR02594 family protein [Shimia sp. R9_3]
MTPRDWIKVQKRLILLGFNPGPVDGIRGRMTIGAIKNFQQSKGLVPDGIVGPLTYEALFGEATGGTVPSFDSLPWFDEANRLMGTREVAGPGNNPVIMDMAADLDIDYAGDDVPWCGLFVAHCIGSTMPAEALPNNPLGARKWMSFGEECEPQLGAVIVFWRESRASWKGHVGFYAGEDASHVHCLGGNQSNAVNIRRFPRNRVLGARWPLTGPSQSGVTLQGGSGVQDTDGDES